MTRTNNAKMHKARAIRAAALKTQVVMVDDDWRIVRFNEQNWMVQHEGQFSGYYGHLLDALQALPAKMLDPKAAGTLDQILELNRSIQARIEATLKLKLA